MIEQVIHIIDSLSIGGAQKLLVTFGMEAKKRGLQTRVISLQPPVENHVSAELKALGVQIDYFPAKGLLNLPRIWSIFRYLQKQQQQVVQTHLMYANFIGGLAAFLAKTPFIATLHLAGDDKRFSKFQILLENWVLRYFASRILGISSLTTEFHQHRFGKKSVTTVLNAAPDFLPVSSSRAMDLRESLALKDARVVIAVGRFSPQKAFDDLIRAFAIVHRQYPNIVLLLVGDGKMRLTWEELARDLQLSDFIRFAGSRNDVPDLLSISDVFALSSIAEGMPLVVMEAMMAGLPVVATSVGELPKVINDKCGILVPPQQPEVLAAAILSILTDQPKLQEMGACARQYALENFASTAWMEKLLGLYLEVIAESTPKVQR